MFPEPGPCRKRSAHGHHDPKKLELNPVDSVVVTDGYLVCLRWNAVMWNLRQAENRSFPTEACRRQHVSHDLFSNRMGIVEGGPQKKFEVTAI